MWSSGSVSPLHGSRSRTISRAAASIVSSYPGSSGQPTQVRRRVVGEPGSLRTTIPSPPEAPASGCPDAAPTSRPEASVMATVLWLPTPSTRSTLKAAAVGSEDADALAEGATDGVVVGRGTTTA